jgi:hypothetical protein
MRLFPFAIAWSIHACIVAVEVPESGEKRLRIYEGVYSFVLDSQSILAMVEKYGRTSAITASLYAPLGRA